MTHWDNGPGIHFLCKSYNIFTGYLTSKVVPNAMEITQFYVLLTFLFLSHRKFKIKPLSIFGDGGKQNKIIVPISITELKGLTSKKTRYLFPFNRML